MLRQPGGIGSIAARQINHDHYLFMAEVAGSGKPSMAPAFPASLAVPVLPAISCPARRHCAPCHSSLNPSGPPAPRPARRGHGRVPAPACDRRSPSAPGRQRFRPRPTPGALSAPGSAAGATAPGHSGPGSPRPALAECGRRARRNSGCRNRPAPLSRRRQHFSADGCMPGSTPGSRRVMCRLRRQKTVVCGSTSRCSRAAARNNGLRIEPGALSELLLRSLSPPPAAGRCLHRPRRQPQEWPATRTTEPPGHASPLPS